MFRASNPAHTTLIASSHSPMQLLPYNSHFYPWNMQNNLACIAMEKNKEFHIFLEGQCSVNVNWTIFTGLKQPNPALHGLMLPMPGVSGGYWWSQLLTCLFTPAGSLTWFSAAFSFRAHSYYPQFLLFSRFLSWFVHVLLWFAACFYAWLRHLF